MAADIRVKRQPDRGKYDRKSIYSILDQALICHVAFSAGDVPYNIPMIPLRYGPVLYVHTSIKSRFYHVLSSGVPTCVAATILDGIVLAKSAYNSSMNYRSAMVFGPMSPVTEEAEKLMAAEKLTEKIAAGRWVDCRQPNEGELRATGFLKLSIDTFSAKVRSGPPGDNPDDLSLPHWSGVIPVTSSKGSPVTAPADQGKIGVPDYL